MILTISDLLDLAHLGRSFILQEAKTGTSHWLGYLPTDTDLDAAQLALQQLCPYGIDLTLKNSKSFSKLEGIQPNRSIS